MARHLGTRTEFKFAPYRPWRVSVALLVLLFAGIILLAGGVGEQDISKKCLTEPIGSYESLKCVDFIWVIALLVLSMGILYQAFKKKHESSEDAESKSHFGIRRKVTAFSVR